MLDRRQDQARFGVLYLKTRARREAVFVSQMPRNDHLTLGRHGCRRHQAILLDSVRWSPLRVFAEAAVGTLEHRVRVPVALEPPQHRQFSPTR